MRSWVRVIWCVAMVAVVGWALVLFASLFGAAALDAEAPPVALILPAVIVPLAMELPARWLERRQGPDVQRVPASTARLVELPAFAGVVAVAAAVAWSSDLRIAALASTCVTAWAIAAPLVLRARLRAVVAER